MRVTNRLLYSALVRDINVSSEKMLTLNKQISSAKIISKPSDDPVGMANILTYRAEMYASEQYLDNITMTSSWISRTDSVLMNVDDLLARSAEITTQQATATSTTATRSGAAEEVEELIEALTGLANSKFGTKYMYGGTDTQNPPFIDIDPNLWAGDVATIAAAAPGAPATGDNYINTADNHIYQYDGASWVDQGLPASGAVVQVADQSDGIFIYNSSTNEWQTHYQGNQDSFSAQISTTDNIKVNVAGDTTFKEAFKALLNLHTALVSDDQPNISAQLTSIENASLDINDKLAIIGARANRLTQAESVLNDAKVDTKERLSDIEDLDYAEAITELENQQTIYQATLKSASMISQLSLVDYI